MKGCDLNLLKAIVEGCREVQITEEHIQEMKDVLAKPRPGGKFKIKDLQKTFKDVMDASKPNPFGDACDLLSGHIHKRAY